MASIGAPFCDNHFNDGAPQRSRQRLRGDPANGPTGRKKRALSQDTLCNSGLLHGREAAKP